MGHSSLYFGLSVGLVCGYMLNAPGGQASASGASAVHEQLYIKEKPLGVHMHEMTNALCGMFRPCPG